MKSGAEYVDVFVEDTVLFPTGIMNFSSYSFIPLDSVNVIAKILSISQAFDL